MSSGEGRDSWLKSQAKRSLYALASQRALVRAGDSRRQEFALTFDDGPDPATTSQVLRILGRYGVRGTFFLVGNRVVQNAALVKAISQEGHEIGSHSHTHPHFERLTLLQAWRETITARSVVEEITGQSCRLFRPPFGKLAIQSLLPAWLQGQCVVMWTVDLKDYRAYDAAEIETRAAAHKFINGDIILYHGLNEAAVRALPRVIEAAQWRGRAGVSVSRLMRRLGPALTPDSQD
jgi:peptidoglycan-N-acetylglucosamine deacetylase